MSEFYDRHRGPYRLSVTRPFKTKPGFFRSEMLAGKTYEGEDVPAEANALLEDPRDCIIAVNVWSEREGQYVFRYEKRA